jgi:hypothetical protein
MPSCSLGEKTLPLRKVAEDDLTVVRLEEHTGDDRNLSSGTGK